MQVSRVFTTGISRNKEIHLKVLIEDDSKIFGSSSIWFSTPKTAREVLIDRNHAGSSKPAQLRVLRNSPRAMPLSGYELVPELTCKESALPVYALTIDV